MGIFNKWREFAARKKAELARRARIRFYLPDGNVVVVETTVELILPSWRKSGEIFTETPGLESMEVELL